MDAEEFGEDEDLCDHGVGAMDEFCAECVAQLEERLIAARAEIRFLNIQIDLLVEQSRKVLALVPVEICSGGLFDNVEFYIKHLQKKIERYAEIEDLRIRSGL